MSASPFNLLALLGHVLLCELHSFTLRTVRSHLYFIMKHQQVPLQFWLLHSFFKRCCLSRVEKDKRTETCHEEGVQTAEQGEKNLTQGSSSSLRSTEMHKQQNRFVCFQMAPVTAATREVQGSALLGRRTDDCLQRGCCCCLCFPLIRLFVLRK